MVLGKRQKSLRPHDTMVRSTCGNCPAGCGVKVFTEGDRIVDILGDEEHPANKGSFCPKGLLAYKHQANHRRLTQPLIRTARDIPLRAVSWPEALAFAALRLKETQGTFGAAGCYVHTNPSSPFGHQLGATFFARGWGTPHGPWRFRPAMLGPEGSLARMFGVEGSRLIMNTPRDWANSQAYVVVGCDLAATDPMTFGPLIDARDRSMEMIVIDSRTTVTMQKASHALRVRPGTEGLALRGILRLVFDNDWVDAGFVREATNGIQELRNELSDYPAEVVAAACGVPLAELQRVAQVIGTTWPLQVITGGWNANERFTDDDLRLCGALAAVRGAVGVPGGGLNVLNASPFDPVDWVDDRADLQGGALALEKVLLDEGAPIEALLMEGDPVERLPGGEATRRRLSRVPFIAALASYENATTAHADVVFPVASWLEHEGLLANGNGRSLQWHHRTVPPPGECRSPLRIWTELATACGIADGMPWLHAPDHDRGAAEWALANNPWTASITVDLLDPQQNPPGGILWPCTDPRQIAFENSRFTPRGDVRGINVLFARGRAFAGTDVRFPTADGRVHLVGSPIGTDVPPKDALLLLPGIAVDHVEQYSGMVTDRVPGRVLPKLFLHPNTAQRLRLADGDELAVENDLGVLHGSTQVSDLVPEGIIGCIALPWMHGNDGSAWSLRAPAAGESRKPYAVVTVRHVR